MKSTPSKRLRLTWSEKVGILDKAARTPALSYRGLAAWAMTEFSLPAAPGKTTICRIIKSSALTALLWCEDAWSKVGASTIRHIPDS
ncbi:hypothetical protein PHYSODRAFT_506402 [Phytophthora sojae]|uniref:Uncharacterized protein n=1 Tax=Phytophthora sojae (strain P6497) TaxID=1094619 RepID=G4ZMJ4_PHYSP|nr:hypothetical protein PHYSODRAFT_506402 [Phytophthora sojae]EGZ15341.1 hypothetical protein PHYSODRAFT_506402 [Phytophthora sojae]|eukprot:XP_009529090.1 hypothetical protein PHYSODRAFT_506402 [Phytophthora sojae]